VQIQTPPTVGSTGPGGAAGSRWALAAVIVGLGVLVFLGVTRWFLAQPVPAPSAPTAAPTPVPTLAPMAAPTPRPTTAPVAATEPAQVPTVTLQPVRTAAPAPAVTATVVPTLAEEWWTRSSNQVDPQQEQLVLAALDRYWAVLTVAWKDLNTSHLDEVLVEPDLSQQKQIFADRRAQQRGIQVKVDRQYRQVRNVQGDEAVVYEEYLNHSQDIDLKTGSPIGESTAKLSAAAYLFRKSASKDWNVAEVATYDTPQAH